MSGSREDRGRRISRCPPVCWLGLALLAGAPARAADVPADPALDRYAEPQRRLSLPGGRAINLLCEGTGAPTVILEAGAGGSTLEWRKVQPAVAQFTQVCAYDRAGMGFSDAGPLPRSADAVVADLEALLAAARLPPPYVLVAHSLGSYFARLYADRHPEEVAGMVLVDPAVEDQDRRFAQVSPGYARVLRQERSMALECLHLARAGALSAELPIFRQCTYGYAREPGFSDALYAVQVRRRLSVPFREALLSETDEMEADSRVLHAARRSYGDMPLIVLTQAPENPSDEPGLSAAEVRAMNAVWMQMHEELAKLSTRGIHQVIEHSGHYIQKDRPDRVIASIRDVVEDRRRH
ncbi:MAG: alpha/beta fold hydrolase [Proteobacteria bacterium]|nr:alpha/beta fold hydrolase [Pseudomonadota bacterium]